MSVDPYYASNPSDSGLLDGVPRPLSTGPSPEGSSVPPRHEYEAPEPAPIDAEAPEESLRDVPLPEGFLSRLRGFVGDL